MTNPMLSLLVRTIGSALAVGAFLLLIYAPNAQAQAPNSGVIIGGQLTMTRTDGPQLCLSDTRFPERGCIATMRGASGDESTAMMLVEHATAGGIDLILQPKGTLQPGRAVAFLAYGVGGLGNSRSTNINLAYSNVDPPFYFIGTSTAGGSSPYAPLRIWNMNHTALIFERDSAGTPYIRLTDYMAFDDSNLAASEPTSRLSMSRLVRATAGQGGLSWPIEWVVPYWDGQGQALRKIRQQAFCDAGVNAECGIRFVDDLNRVLFSTRTDGFQFGGAAFIPAQAEPPAIAGGVQVFTKDNGGRLSLCAKFPNGQVKCFVLQD